MHVSHREKVKKIQSEVRKLHRTKQPFYIFHGSTNSTRHQRFKRESTIDVSHLNEILSVDKQKHLAVVEPNVPMDKLVRETLKYGVIPPVVMEFPGITVGGGIQGFAGESSSYKYGMFASTVRSIEMVLADGRGIIADGNTNSDLFEASAGSFGTFGVLTSAELNLVLAKKYVILTYEPVDSYKQAVELISRACVEPVGTHDYIDGIMFSPNNGVVMLGKLSDIKQGRIARFSRAHDEWFYLHAEKISRRAERHTETIPLVDYLFRYDRGAFWTGRFAFERSGWPFNRLSRWLTNNLMNTRKLYRALHDSGAADQYIVQDLALPITSAETFMKYIEKKLNTFPLWLCPLMLDHDWIMMREQKKELVINVGVWNNQPYYNYDSFVVANRNLEHELRKLGGQKWFYAHNYYSEDEFWGMYDKKKYDQLREKYSADSLPNIYDKIRSRGRRPVRIKRASFRTLFGLAGPKIED